MVFTDLSYGYFLYEWAGLVGGPVLTNGRRPYFMHDSTIYWAWRSLFLWQSVFYAPSLCSPPCGFWIKVHKPCCYLSPHRQYGTKCARCARSIHANDWVRRARSSVYHLACFACDACKRQLSTGEEFALKEGHVLCKLHYMESLEVFLPDNSSQEGRRILFLILHIGRECFVSNSQWICCLFVRSCANLT